MAHQELGLATIRACVLDGRLDPTEAKVISLTENLVRREVNRRDLIDACTELYKKYGTIKDVADKTGLPRNKVAQYVKYDRLIPELQQLVDSGRLDVNGAVRAQDAASVLGTTNAQEAIALAEEMTAMSGAQQKRVVEERSKTPEKPVDEIIEHARHGGRITQVVVTLSDSIHRGLQRFARDESSNQDEAAAILIEEGLSGKGYVGSLQ